MELQIDSQVGSMKEDIDIEKEGKDIMIGFNPKFLIDKTYILSAMGLLAQEYPNIAIRIMKKFLVKA